MDLSFGAIKRRDFLFLIHFSPLALGPRLESNQAENLNGGKKE